jgi:O-antigen ligase
MFEQAVLLIEEQPVRGAGLGTEVHISSGKEHRVHNVFLSSWLEMGILGLLTSLAYYLALLTAWGTFIARIVLSPSRWRLRAQPEWVAVLPVLPMMRVLLSGSGAFTLVEWFCLALFFGLLAKNESQRSSAPRPDPLATVPA